MTTTTATAVPPAQHLVPGGARLTVLGRLTASEDRTLRGMLLPYGEPGYTNKGRVVARRGSCTIPEDLGRLNCSLDHLDARDDVARFVSITETDAGLMAEWTVPETHGGDRLLAEFREGKRTGVSVELEPWQVKDGVLTASAVAGCAFPARPAFPTARLMAELAPDATSDQLRADYSQESTSTETSTYTGEDGKTYTVTTTRTVRESSETTTDPDDDDADDTTTTQEDPTVSTPVLAAAHAGAPADLPRPGQGAPAPLLASDSSASHLFDQLARANGGQDRRLMAELVDVTRAHLGATEQPAYVGELWSGVPYQRRIVPLLNHADLTSYEVRGWRWVTKPAMAPYAGDKAPVPSNGVQTEPVTTTAERLAGAHDIDRRYRDFGDAAFFQAYYAAMAESYARLSDAAVLAAAVGAAQPVTLGPVPDGIGAGWAAVVDAALQVVDTGSPTFAVVHRGVWRSMVLTPKDQVLEYLSAALGLEDGQLAGFRVIPDNTTLTDGQVLVGARSAATVHELGGGAPIRVEALDVANGGVDAGCFGYYAVNVHDDDALALADLTPAA